MTKPTSNGQAFQQLGKGAAYCFIKFDRHLQKEIIYFTVERSHSEPLRIVGDEGPDEVHNVRRGTG